MWQGAVSLGRAVSLPVPVSEEGHMFSRFGVVDLCAAWIAIGACILYVGLLCWNGYDDYRIRMGKRK